MIEIYHNVLTPEEESELTLIFRKAKWSYTGISNPNPKRVFWYMDLTNEPFVANRLFTKIKSLLERDVEMLRVYANGQTCGLDGEFHQDGQDPEDYTFLYYFNPIITNDDILKEYGGHTQFRFEDEHILYSIEPRHNTAILFPGQIYHRGMAPSSREYGLRITIAFKLKEIKPVHSD